MNIHPAFLINVQNLNLKNYFILYHLQLLSSLIVQVSVQLSLRSQSGITPSSHSSYDLLLLMRDCHHYQSWFIWWILSYNWGGSFIGQGVKVVLTVYRHSSVTNEKNCFTHKYVLKKKKLKRCLAFLYYFIFIKTANNFHPPLVSAIEDMIAVLACEMWK